VAKFIGLELCDGQHYKPNASYWDGHCKMFNPCNNPADAWPIIVENKISLFAIRYTESMWQAEHPITGIFKHENPLRAAMIVFLMMQEAEQ